MHVNTSRTTSAERETPAAERAVDLLIDYLAVAGRGAVTPAAKAVRRSSVVSDGVAVVEGTQVRAVAEEAALFNGTGAHSIELDDTFEPGSLHPGVAVWPAVLALADELGSSGNEVVRAASRGYDVACTLGEHLGPARAYERGFHPTGICGVVGAAAACAGLLGLDDDHANGAMGIAVSFASGLLAYLDDGSWTKPLHAGRAAAGGIRAARLAAAGFLGPRDAFSGPHGFFNAFAGRGSEALPERLSADAVERTSIKLYPTCRYTHGCIDLLLELSPDPDEVEAIECGVLRAGWTLVAEPLERKRQVTNRIDAQFSMPFTAALAISRGGVELEDIDCAARLASSMAGLVDRITCVADDPLEAAYPEAWGAVVTVRYRSGKTEQRRETDLLGSPARPLARAEILAKASSLRGREWAAAAAAVGSDVLSDAPLSEVLAGVRPGL